MLRFTTHEKNSRSYLYGRLKPEDQLFSEAYATAVSLIRKTETSQFAYRKRNANSAELKTIVTSTWTMVNMLRKP